MTIETARAKRQKLVQAAEHLASVSLRVDIPTDRISGDMIDALPDWCCNDISTIRSIQKTCGALYFSPVIASSIDGRMLRDFRDFVGAQCFEFVRTQYEADHTVNAAISGQRLPVTVMAAGSAVLLSTLQHDRLVQMYEQVIGPGSINLPRNFGNSIVRSCNSLLLAKTANGFEQ